jgi:hypothetical protein
MVIISSLIILDVQSVTKPFTGMSGHSLHTCYTESSLAIQLYSLKEKNE